jgi:hypothetical protein
MKTYVIDYKVYYTDNTVSQEHTIKIKNCDNDIHAKVRLEGYLIKKHKDKFKSLHVIRCNEDYMGIFSMLGINNPFGDIFK